jgi:hypothetical protein
MTRTAPRPPRSPRERDADQHATLPDVVIDDVPLPAPADPPRPGTSVRLLVFLLLCTVAIIGGGAYTVIAVREHNSTAGRASGAGPANPDALAGLSGPANLLFLDTVDIADPYRKIARSAIGGSAGGRDVTGELCQRVYMAAGRGLCLTLGYELSRGSAFIFDADMKVVHSVSASGLPSRARVSPDGRYGSMTFFVFGHAYSGGAFSTRTDIVAMATGDIVSDLESFEVYRDGVRFHSEDFNFWGVTFAADSNRFYATLGTGDSTYLVEGDIAARRLRTLRENVECPSLSPDGGRIVFKKKVATTPITEWRLTVLDLATMTETQLPETRSIDDQAEWLDDKHVLYSPPTSIPEVWVMPVDGSGPPRQLLTHAFSPSVQR